MSAEPVELGLGQALASILPQTPEQPTFLNITDKPCTYIQAQHPFCMSDRGALILFLRQGCGGLHRATAWLGAVIP